MQDCLRLSVRSRYRHVGFTDILIVGQVFQERSTPHDVSALSMQRCYNLTGVFLVKFVSC